jgi:phosphatidylserine decarboxylase
MCYLFTWSAIPRLLSAGLFLSQRWLLLFIISFFRIPKRTLTVQENAIVAPADGKVVVIEEVQADEYFTDRRIQVSIFMSPLNVHVNRNPVNGEVVYSQYHKGNTWWPGILNLPPRMKDIRWYTGKKEKNYW